MLWTEMKKRTCTAILLILLAAGLALWGCSPADKTIVILENGRGTGCSFTLNHWSGSDNCELSLQEGDVLSVEIDRDDGEIGLTIQSKNGSEPYTGNELDSGVFTVTVHETDTYLVSIRGMKATGLVTVEKAEPAQ